MKKIFNLMAICLTFIFICSLGGCANNGKTNDGIPTQEIIELTTDNWKEYLAYQKTSSTTPVTTRSLYGITLYESTGTFTVKFYSKSNVKYENVNISISLKIYTDAYSTFYIDDKSSTPLSDRIPDDWYFASKPYPTKDSNSGTWWTITKSGILSNDGEISFSEPCKMLYAHQPIYGGVHYNSLEDAVGVYVEDISGQVIFN